MNIKRWLIIISILVFFFGIFQATQAEASDNVFITFDKGTLERGYTVKSSDNKFWLPIFPNQFQNQLAVQVKKINNAKLLPSNKKPVSDFYLYDIKTGYPGFLKSAALLSLKFDSENLKPKSIFYYDNHYASWRPLTSWVDYKNNIIQAKTIFPYAQIVVLEDDLNYCQNPNAMTAAAALVIDKQNNHVLFSKNAEEQRSIASLTKLMTALIFLENNPGWDVVVTMQESDFVGGASLWVPVGTQITVRDLFYSMMIGSKNNAVMALVRATGLTNEQFVAKMNQKAARLGLEKTNFTEPTGLSEKNVSTAFEISKLARLAFANPIIYNATTTKSYSVKPINSELTYPVINTSQKVLERDLDITGSKTGYTHEAGYCLVTQAKNFGRELIALVLGAKIRQNYEEVYGLLKENLQ